MSATRRLTTFTMLCALAILFHYVESLIVIPLPVPGFRLGLANIIALITLYLYDARAMLAVSLMRVLFVSLLQGTLFATSFWLSLSGVLLSCAAMSIARRCRCFSIYGVSGTTVYYAVYTGGDSVTLSEGEYSKVTGTLKDGEDGESGTVMFYDANGFTVKATTDKDGAFTALMPTGTYTVNAYNSGDRVYLGTASVTHSQS